MKITYESFAELAREMTKGDGRLHRANCPGVEKCIEWQHGVHDFAGWLDHIGVPVAISDDAVDEFFHYVRDKQDPAKREQS